MPVRFQKWITRQDLKNNPNVYYVFGDNFVRVGLGGQAKEMRGEPNAIGVATKWKPGTQESDYYSDDTMAPWIGMSQDIDRLGDLLDEGHTIVFPFDGLGTGLSQLPRRAPQLYKRLYNAVQSKCDEIIPWEKPK